MSRNGLGAGPSFTSNPSCQCVSLTRGCSMHPRDFARHDEAAPQNIIKDIAKFLIDGKIHTDRLDIALPLHPASNVRMSAMTRK